MKSVIFDAAWWGSLVALACVALLAGMYGVAAALAIISFGPVARMFAVVKWL